MRPVLLFVVSTFHRGSFSKRLRVPFRPRLAPVSSELVDGGLSRLPLPVTEGADISARLLFIAILALALSARPLFAADQTEHLKKLPERLPTSVPIASPDVNDEQMRTFMSVAFPQAGTEIDSPAFY